MARKADREGKGPERLVGARATFDPTRWYKVPSRREPTPGASGSNLTLESRMGFLRRIGGASLRNARWKIALRFVRRYSSAQGSGSRPQHAAEARLAG